MFHAVVVVVVLLLFCCCSWHCHGGALWFVFCSYVCETDSKLCLTLLLLLLLLCCCCFVVVLLLLALSGGAFWFVFCSHVCGKESEFSFNVVAVDVVMLLLQLLLFCCSCFVAGTVMVGLCGLSSAPTSVEQTPIGTLM